MHLVGTFEEEGRIAAVDFDHTLLDGLHTGKAKTEDLVMLI